MKTDALLTLAIKGHNRLAGMIPADAIDSPPVPVPGLDGPLITLVGWVKWFGLSVAGLAVLVGLVVVIGTVFAGWSVAKKAVMGILIALIGGVALGGVGALIGSFF